MADGRKNNGAKKGENRGQGRKTKAEELKVRKLCESAIIRIYGSIDNFYAHLVAQSQDSFPHLKLLMDYYIGKPKETKDITINEIQPLFPDEL